MKKYGLAKCPVFKEAGDACETAPFGEKRGGYIHKGVDIVRYAGYNTTATITAIAGGTVTAVKNTVTGTDHKSNPEGNYVCIDHGGGMASKYFHLKYGSIPAAIRKGAAVEAGDVLGFMGNTGDSYGAHLHFQLELNGKPIDGAPYLKGQKTIGADQFEKDLAVLVEKKIITTPEHWRQLGKTDKYFPVLVRNVVEALR